MSPTELAKEVATAIKPYETAVTNMYAAVRGETEEAPVLFLSALIEHDERVLKRAAGWAAQWMADHCNGIGAPNEEDLLEFQQALVEALTW